jgi:hypothetical protein
VTPFAEFVLSQLPPLPVRVLEVGCGDEGGVTPELAAAGYDVLGIDPQAPEGPLFRRIALEQLDDPGPFAAVVASRVLHHVHPLGAALDKLAGLAPLLLLDEFAWELLDEPTQDWYEAQYRTLVAAGRAPSGPPDLDRWRELHQDLHRSDDLLREIDARYEQRFLEAGPYLYRWLGGFSTESLEEGLIAAGAIKPLGVRYAGVARTATVRSSAAPR